MKSSTRAFTLVELIIVIIVVAILSIVAVASYRTYVAKSVLSEAKMVMNAVEKYEKIYHQTYGKYHEVPEGTSYDPDLDINIASNKYFTSFSVTTEDNDHATAITQGADIAANISLTLQFYDVERRPRWIQNDTANEWTKTDF
jgi:prepilin-type N-terminal cleavage/methylation domain-containing protein